MTSSGEEGATYCCCSWRGLPRALKWAIIGCCVVMLASFIATLYIFTKHGADGFSPHGSGQWRQLVSGADGFSPHGSGEWHQLVSGADGFSPHGSGQWRQLVSGEDGFSPHGSGQWRQLVSGEDGFSPHGSGQWRQLVSGEDGFSPHGSGEWRQLVSGEDGFSPHGSGQWCQLVSGADGFSLHGSGQWRQLVADRRITIRYRGRSMISRRRRCQPSKGRQHTNLPKFLENCMKLRKFGNGGPNAPLPLGAQILSILCSFWENLAKSYVGSATACRR